LSPQQTPHIRVAIAVGDPDLASRLSAALANVATIRIVREDESPDAILGDTKLDARPDSALTQREFEVLALLAEGASNKVIARRLGISPHTAKFHVGSLIDKLDATGRTDAVAHAARSGIIQL
jgi:DNA-binding CsgD family transcriptional regulator